MSLVISDDIVYATHMTQVELLQEIAILLYEKGKLSIGKASKLAQTSRMQFQFLLASRQIPLNYGLADFDADLKTLHQMGQL